jgi:amino acid transporter
VSGGTARFPHLAYGPGAGISFGFFSWLQAVTVPPIEAFAVIHYAGYYWKAIYDPTANGGNGNVTHWGFVLEIALMAVFTAVNFLPMRIYGPLFSAVTWWKVAIPVLTIIILFTKFHSANLTAGGGFFPTGTGLKDLFGALPGAGIVFAYLGFEQADQLAGEIKDPQRNLPRAIILAVTVGIIIYCLLQLAFIGAMPPSLLTHGFAGISNKDILSGPFAGLAGVVGLAWLAFILRVDAFISPFGTGLIYTTGTSRVSYGLGRNRYFPPVFTKTDKRGIPWVGLFAAFIIGLFFLLPFPSWHSLVGLITGASVLMYSGAPLSLGAFRRQVPEADRPYRLPIAAILCPFAFIVGNLLIYWSGFEVIWKLGIVLIIGYVIISVLMAFDKQRPRIQWKSAIWLPVWLIGLGIISWQGQFSGAASSDKHPQPPTITMNIPFWWDIVAVAGLSLIIYYWAMYSRLPREEMLDLVGRQANEEPEPGPQLAG